jgi:hypothetical protein
MALTNELLEDERGEAVAELSAQKSYPLINQSLGGSRTDQKLLAYAYDFTSLAVNVVVSIVENHEYPRT